ncbi:hypothetical protein AOQ73_04785 [Bradyrhizobium pachyrhizi]|uniref:hypothetical protein n=1 Tax=Bradyrhizobium pachyrhizi TaxID=280333 RepID=UPI000704FD87|nr:hypothetical protein [Bradyrhizobium pachyrhizi]KRQ12159.1 hypothetical protein AOQ73_04785 [Bradyrhizobium pachyrhizi]
MLADELHAFLLEQEMTSESPRLEDFAAAIVYVQAGSRISNAFEEIFDHVSEKKGFFTKGSVLDDMHLDFDSEQNLIHGWKNLSAAPLMTAYFAYGIALQPRRSLQPDGIRSKESLPIENSIFLCLGVTSKREMKLLEEHANNCGSGWQYFAFGANSIIATFKPLKDILMEPEAFAGTMKSWIDQAVPEILPVISIMQKQAAT